MLLGRYITSLVYFLSSIFKVFINLFSLIFFGTKAEQYLRSSICSSYEKEK